MQSVAESTIFLLKANVALGEPAKIEHLDGLLLQLPLLSSMPPQDISKEQYAALILSIARQLIAEYKEAVAMQIQVFISIVESGLTVSTFEEAMAALHELVRYSWPVASHYSESLLFALLPFLKVHFESVKLEPFFYLIRMLAECDKGFPQIYRQSVANTFQDNRPASLILEEPFAHFAAQ